MDSITELIKSEIKRQYKNLRQFSEKSGIPYSTLSNALSRGIGSTSYDTVVYICKILNLRQICDDNLIVFNDEFKNICDMFMKLDQRGIHTVETILKVEYNRCINEDAEPAAAAYNGLTFTSEDVDVLQKKKRISELVKGVKEVDVKR